MSLACEIKERIEKILPDGIVCTSTESTSYVKCLIPRFRDTKTLLLYRESSSQHIIQHQAVLDSHESTELDLTGSPLKYDLDYSGLEEMIVDKRNWKKEEELHLPLAKLEACVALNCCAEIPSNQDWPLPLLAICNGKNNDKTVLMGFYVENGWYTTIQGRISNAEQVSNLKKTPAVFLNEYTDKFSVNEDKVSMSLRSTYELCGQRPGVIDSLDLSPDCFGGNLSIEVNWNTLSFYAPIGDCKTNLVMEIIAGSNGSYLKQLWKELTLLHHYLNILEQCKPDERIPRSFASSNSANWDVIEGKLNLLLTGQSENTSYIDDDYDDHHNLTDDAKLKQHIENVQFRRNRDFADMFWELLMGCAEFGQITDCFRTLFHEIELGIDTPQISQTGSSRITKIISEFQKGAMLPKLRKNLALELLIDTGIEKLTRDYMNILLSTNLINISDIQQILYNVQQGSFNIESYRKKLTSLAQIHLCLEFTLFAENYLACSTTNLQTIFNYAFHKYASKNSAIKSFSDLSENQIQWLNVSLVSIAVKQIIQGLPSSWCLTLSSEGRASKRTTTLYLSRTPILPPNIYCFDESNNHEVYHSLKLDTSSIKIM